MEETGQVIKPRLVYRLIPLEGACVFQVLEMDEWQRSGRSDPELDFVASNGVRVLSAEQPELERGGDTLVYLRGENKGQDFEPDCATFTDNLERDEYIAKVHAALREWHEAGGFEKRRRYSHGTQALAQTDPHTVVLDGDA